MAYFCCLLHLIVSKVTPSTHAIAVWSSFTLCKRCNLHCKCLASFLSRPTIQVSSVSLIFFLCFDLAHIFKVYNAILVVEVPNNTSVMLPYARTSTSQWQFCHHILYSYPLKSQSTCVHNLHLQYVVNFIWRFVIVSQNFTRVHLVPPELWNRINWSVSERVSPVVRCSNMSKYEIQNTRGPYQCTFRWNQREGTKEKNENSI